MKKLWQKNKQLNTQVEEYCSKENVAYDDNLIVYDCYGSIAHAAMLSKIGIISNSEYSDLQKGLIKIVHMTKEGKFHVSFGDEDVHTKIENELTKILGQIGEKLHTGRSRNDQILTDIRLYSKAELIDMSMHTVELAKSFFTFAKTNEFTLMPGYTHAQIAMPSTVGLWASSFGESLLDDLLSLEYAFGLNDQSPLGSGASYGVSLPIDRKYTSNLLGFSKVQSNSLYAQCSRIKAQLAVVSACHQIMLTLSRCAEDILTFTMSEFGFFSLPDELCTGSSIMPQKKNVDIMEIVRARTHRVAGAYQTLASIGTNLLSGYNSDYQETKAPFMDAISITKSSIAIVNLTINHLVVHKNILINACAPELVATHVAYELVKKGMPFRTAYQKVGSELESLPKYDFQEIIKSSNHEGGPGNLQLDHQFDLAEMAHKNWSHKKDKFRNVISGLLQI